MPEVELKPISVDYSGYSDYSDVEPEPRGRPPPRGWRPQTRACAQLVRTTDLRVKTRVRASPIVLCPRARRRVRRWVRSCGRLS